MRSQRVESFLQVTQKTRPNLLTRKIQHKRLRLKQFGRFFRVYSVQSVHAPHSKQVNAARIMIGRTNGVIRQVDVKGTSRSNPTWTCRDDSQSYFRSQARLRGV